MKNYIGLYPLPSAARSLSHCLLKVLPLTDRGRQNGVITANRGDTVNGKITEQTNTGEECDYCNLHLAVFLINCFTYVLTLKCTVGLVFIVNEAPYKTYVCMYVHRAREKRGHSILGITLTNLVTVL